MRDARAGGWSRQTESVLRRAGWQPGRSVPTGTWESVLRERGPFVVHDAARRFLSEFGGLVTYGWPADTITTSTAVRFDPLRASWHGERVARASREAKVRLCPVGTADEGASILAVSDEGAFHLIRDRAEQLGMTTEPYRRPWDSTPCVEFSMDPLSAFWDAEIIEDLAEQAGVDLFPIGTRDRGNQYLAMAEAGAVYAGMDSVWLLAPTPEETLQRLTTRIRPTPGS